MARIGRNVLGELLTVMRNGAGLSVAQLAEKLKCSRAWIYDIEAGRKNFTIDEYDRLLQGCGVSTDSATRGLRASDLPEQFHDLFWMLKTIIESGDDNLILGIRVNLDAISEKALRIKKARASPSPDQRAGQEDMVGNATGSRHHHKRKTGT